MTASQRIVFMGSPDFAVPALRALHAHHEIIAVVTQPDRPKGRGRAFAAPPVKVAAEELNAPLIMQPRTLRQRAVREQLEELLADLFVVVAFGQILRPKLLAAPRLGCLNVHGLLLPRHRGAAPIQWAVLEGDERSGVTIMQMDAGIDTGPTLLVRELALAADETAGSLHDRLAPLGAELLLEAIDGLASGAIAPQAQSEHGATLARMLEKNDGEVDWSRGARVLDCWIRGLDPWPGAYTSLDGARLKLFGSRYDSSAAGRPGEVLTVDDRGLLVSAGDGAGLWVRELQLPGKRRLPAAALSAGRPIPAGTLLG